MIKHEYLEPVALDDNTVESVPISSEQLESILVIQQVVLRAIAEDKRDSEILDKLCLLAEGLLPNSAASVMQLHQDGRLMSVVSAPSIPEEGQIRLANINANIGFGSCTAAVLHGKPAYIRNTLTDYRTSKALDMVRDFNICSCWSVPVHNRDGKIVGCFSLASFESRIPTIYHDRLMKTCSSVVSILSARKALRRLSMTDKLTGLWNRAKLDSQLSMNKAAYSRDCEPYCVMILDIDHFKAVNDTYGHNAGDKVLVEVSNILKRTVRANDIVGRWGGEEFMIILSKSEGAKARVVAEKIRLAVMHNDFAEVGKVTVSLGVFEMNKDDLSNLDVINYADQALYKAKERGRNRVCLFEVDFSSISAKKKAVITQATLAEME